MRSIARVALLLCVLGGAAARAENAGGSAEEDANVFARVGSTVIPRDEFETNFYAGIRQRFFHGSVPEAEITAFRREVAEAMIDRVVLLQEAERRGLKPDAKWVDERVKATERRTALAADPDAMRSALREQLLGDSVIKQLQEQVEAIKPPDRAALLDYYHAHPDKFTTPERLRVSLILLKVEPWSPNTVWQAAQDEAGHLVGKIHAGERFEDLARVHSADASAAQGGDLGYVHRGMLAAEAQNVIDGMKPGDVSEPIRLLQGFAILRLDERVPPVLNDFEHAQDRARELLTRELQEQAWQAMRAELRNRTVIQINEAVLSDGGQPE